jgi:RNA polymerase sigma factor (sigma-70 family)
MSRSGPTGSKAAGEPLVVQNDPEQPLSLIPTLWSLVGRANGGTPPEAALARQQLLERYGDAIQRYLRNVLRDPHAADEVFQEFALRLVRGKLRGANPERGRFRYFVKGTLYHLIANYREQKRDWPAPLPVEVAGQIASPEEAPANDLFNESWSHELLAHSWEALAAVEARTGQALHSVLRFRADHPDMKSPQMAQELSARLGKSLTAVGIRQTLHRAREKFAESLLDQVIHSLASPEAVQVMEELAELGLLEYCRPALEQRGLTA